MEEYLQIGVITTTHGVRGEVKVYPTTDPERFLSLDRVFLDTGKEKKELHVTGVRFFKQLAIVKFKGIDNINDIERYKGCSLYVTREDATNTISQTCRECRCTPRTANCSARSAM